MSPPICCLSKDNFSRTAPLSQARHGYARMQTPNANAIREPNNFMLRIMLTPHQIGLCRNRHAIKIPNSHVPIRAVTRTDRHISRLREIQGRSNIPPLNLKHCIQRYRELNPRHCGAFNDKDDVCRHLGIGKSALRQPRNGRAKSRNRQARSKGHRKHSHGKIISNYVVLGQRATPLARS